MVAYFAGCAGDRLLSALSTAIAFLTRREPSGVEAVFRGAMWRARFASSRLRVGRGQLIGPRMRFGADVSLLGNSYLNATGENGSLTIGDETHVDRREKHDTRATKD